MRRLLLRMSPALHLTRITTAFAAVANVWFVILWTNAAEQEPGTPTLDAAHMWVQLLGGAVNALGLFGFATALNDVVDLRRDQTMHPDRPLPRGHVSFDGAITLIVCTFGAAVLGATVLGMQAVLLTLVVAGACLFFNATAKFIPAVGLVVLGLIYAGQMVIPNLQLRFVWPVWLVMTHALVVGAITYALAKKSPVISPRAVVFALTGWVFWSTVMLVVGWHRSSPDPGARSLWPEWVHPTACLFPLALCIAFAVHVWRRVRIYGRTPRAAEKIARYGALWLALYSCSWLVGQAYWFEAFVLGTLTVGGFLGMTVLREAYALLEHPLGYRR